MVIINKKYTASSYVLDDFDRLLCIYHKKFNKWLQPGGHIEDGEEPYEAAIREVFEETGINICIEDKVPFNIKEYHTPIGIQVDYQFLGLPTNTDIHVNFESNDAKWLSLEEMNSLNVADDLVNGYKMALTLKRKLKM